MLGSNSDNKSLVSSVFESVMAAPQTFGTVSSNLPRVKQSELLTPVELLVVLHHDEKDLGWKLISEGETAYVQYI